jgi:hypothetical protein
VHGRVFFGAAAWLLGAVAATGGSLLAVSLIGQGIAGIRGQQLTAAAVKHEFAAEAAGSPAAGPAASLPPAAKARPLGRPRHSRSVTPATSAPRPASASPAATAPAAGGTVLSSRGGKVMATCRPAGAYLEWWSPQQGYEVDEEFQGPAATVRVVFESSGNSVAMVVTCRAGVPVLTSSSHGDD